MTVEDRIIVNLADQHATLPVLVSLFQSDREAFYHLAVRPPELLPADVQPHARLANALRFIVRNGYSPYDDEVASIVHARFGLDITKLGMSQDEVHAFLREVDGKSTTDNPGKDYLGQSISQSEVEFKLGTVEQQAALQKKLRLRNSIAPTVFRLSDDVKPHLQVQPAYVTHQLVDCARRTVLAPTAVYKGLKRGNDAPSSLNRGWAFVGRPRYALDNQGERIQVPDDFVYVVYADASGYVFDWDWVKASPGELGHPLNCDMRFEDIQNEPPEAEFELPSDLVAGEIDSSHACYSVRGDCVFCYISDELAYAERINSDLTVFYGQQSSEVTGFKLKNIQRIVRDKKVVVLRDAPRLRVEVDSMLFASLSQQSDIQSVPLGVYKIVIRALYTRLKTSSAPEVDLPDSVFSDEVSDVSASH